MNFAIPLKTSSGWAGNYGITTGEDQNDAVPNSVLAKCLALASVVNDAPVADVASAIQAGQVTINGTSDT